MAKGDLQMFSYETNKAILNIYAGAGGVDAQDWANMLLRMYQRYIQRQNWRFSILSDSYGEQGGLKSASCEIVGPDAYAILKGESGVHRLVRISPFSAKKLRHTSFALIEIMPAIVPQALQLNPGELRVDTYRSSGKG